MVRTDETFAFKLANNVTTDLFNFLLTLSYHCIIIVLLLFYYCISIVLLL